MDKVDWIKTIKDLSIAIVNTPDVEDFNGNMVSPELLIEDSDGNEYKIDDFYLTGADKIKIKLERK